jgi:hypothetical protein
VLALRSCMLGARFRHVRTSVHTQRKDTRAAVGQAGFH